ncbi:MAG: hypothetical protein CVV27_06295, partial [Candidatus Melainabacteria bacterium HGW-Melainabacteria-1]
FAPLTVPTKFARLTGSWHNRHLSLETYRYSHPDLIHLSLALLQEGEACRAVTLYALPRPSLALPILGLDYVGFGGQLTLAALDLAPTEQAFWERQAKPLLTALQSDREELIARRLPAFAMNVFSDRPLIVAAKTQVGIERAVRHACTTLNHYREWLNQPEQTTHTQSDRLRNWCQAMANNKKESGALGQMFGTQAQAYLEDYLFAA